MKINTLDSVDVAGKIVLVRADLNVPLKDGVITELTRIKASVPTIDYLLTQGAKQIHILSHLGRPKGERKPEYSLAPVANALEEELGEDVFFAENFSDVPTGATPQIILHENTRYYKGEKKNDPALAEEILKYTKAEIFVNDGFAVSHRGHASVVGFAGKIPCYAGKLIEKEIKHLSPFVSSKQIDGLTIIVGGAKMKTKVAVLKHFAKTASNICIGGALANTFLAASGFDVGKSLYEKEEIDTARTVIALAEEHKTGIHLPVDVVCAETPNSKALPFPIEDVSGDLCIFDIGIHTVDSYEEILMHSKTIIWNGPVGFYEKEAFGEGTRRIANHLVEHCKAQTILGGGDTLDALKKFNISQDNFTHVSTGGGAMLEFLEGKALPGIEILKD